MRRWKTKEVNVEAEEDASVQRKEARKTEEKMKQRQDSF